MNPDSITCELERLRVTFHISKVEIMAVFLVYKDASTEVFKHLLHFCVCHLQKGKFTWPEVEGRALGEADGRGLERKVPPGPCPCRCLSTPAEKNLALRMLITHHFGPSCPQIWFLQKLPANSDGSRFPAGILQTFMEGKLAVS